MHYSNNCRGILGIAAAVLLAISTCAEDVNTTNSANAISVKREQVRAECLAGRRMICGKILRVLADGLVVDSGYTDLLRRPLTDSWLLPGTVTATRAPDKIESHEPGAVCFGPIFLTDPPRARGKKPKPYDYIILLGYPVGEHTYTSVGNVQKTVRHFSASLEAAVKSRMAEYKKTGGSATESGSRDLALARR